MGFRKIFVAELGMAAGVFAGERAGVDVRVDLVTGVGTGGRESAAGANKVGIAGRDAVAEATDGRRIEGAGRASSAEGDDVGGKAFRDWTVSVVMGE